jgi:hypothetical protein
MRFVTAPRGMSGGEANRTPVEYAQSLAALGTAGKQGKAAVTSMGCSPQNDEITCKRTDRDDQQTNGQTNVGGERTAGHVTAPWETGEESSNSVQQNTVAMCMSTKLMQVSLLLPTDYPGGGATCTHGRGTVSGARWPA